MSENLIHSFDGKSDDQQSSKSFIIKIIIGSLIVGIIGGLIFSSMKKSTSTDTTKAKTFKGQTIGIADKKTFKDQAEGYLKEGGIDGEGSFHLERPGGTSQNVYLTSTTVDLLQYTGKKVRVWGQTFTSQKAGWLMDVGLVEILQ